MITDKSRYGHDAVLDLDCGDAVQVLRTEPMTLTEEEQAIVRAYLGIMLLNKSYINPNGHLILVMSDGREYDLGTARGLPGATPYLGTNGNWFVEGRDTLQSARGLPGLTPYIKDGYWWIGDQSTGQLANTVEIVDDLNTDDANKVLSAAQGKVLGDKLKKSKRLTLHYEGRDETETIEVYIK